MEFFNTADHEIAFDLAGKHYRVPAGETLSLDASYAPILAKRKSALKPVASSSESKTPDVTHDTANTAEVVSEPVLQHTKLKKPPKRRTRTKVKSANRPAKTTD